MSTVHNYLGQSIGQPQTSLSSEIPYSDFKRQVAVSVQWTRCPNEGCCQILVRISRTLFKLEIPAQERDTWFALPVRIPPRAINELIKDPFAKDFIEACLILYDSPRMSSVLSLLGIEASCVWPSEPAFTLEESARIMGITKRNLVYNLRNRHPEIRMPSKGVLKLRTPFGAENPSKGGSQTNQYLPKRGGRPYPPPKGEDGLSSPFGPSLTEFGEVTLTLDTPGGPQDHVCLTHYGLFRHAVYIRTPQARRFVLRYPEFILALATGQFRAPAKIAARYKFVLSAPTRLHPLRNMWYVEAECGIPDRTIRRHLSKIQQGKVDSSGLPIRRKPGPAPKRKALHGIDY